MAEDYPMESSDQKNTFTIWPYFSPGKKTATTAPWTNHSTIYTNYIMYVCIYIYMNSVHNEIFHKLDIFSTCGHICSTQGP